MVKTSDILVKGVKSMFDVLATVVNDSCLSVTTVSQTTLEEIMNRCHTFVDTTKSFSRVTWGCVSNQMQSSNVLHHLHDQWSLIRNAMLQELLLAVTWSQADQMIIDDRLQTMTLVLEQEAIHILVEELLRDTIDCNVAFSFFTDPETVVSQLTSNATFVVPTPFQIQFTQNRNFIREFNSLHVMTDTKDQRQERAILSIVFVVVIALLFFIVVVILIRHRWWILPKLERSTHEQQIITTQKMLLQNNTKIVFVPE